jgi:para-aminobenzoate synthetase component 1
MQFLIFRSLFHPVPEAPVPLQERGTFGRDDLNRLVDESGVTACVSQARYIADVVQIKELIAQGEIYQANYTQAFDLTTSLSPGANWQRLRKRVAAPYSAYLSFDACEIPTRFGGSKKFPAYTALSASPERFWRKRGALLDSRPIKGTIARGGNSAEDRSRRRGLLESAKDRAELLMITDLVRNDLGCVAEIASVRAASLARIRPAPSVWHLESTVTARLPLDRTWVDVMRALLPAGSITGTPKRRAVEILAKLEPVERGAYCGAIGWVDAHGDADFAVGIRTCVQIGNRIRIHGGGGIVADSDPESEYYESLVKIAAMIEILSDSAAPERVVPEPMEPTHA